MSDDWLKFLECSRGKALYWIDHLLVNPNITWEMLQASPNQNWDWFIIGNNSSITLDIIEKHPEKPWDWSALSANPNITWDYIQAHPDKPWNWWYMSWNPNISYEVFKEKGNEENLNWKGISRHISIEIILANLNKPWDW